MDCHGHLVFGSAPNPGNPLLGVLVPDTLAVGVHFSKPFEVGYGALGKTSFVFTAEGVGGVAGVDVDVLVHNRSNDDAEELPVDLGVTSPAGLSSVADGVEELAVLVVEIPYNYAQVKLTVTGVPVLVTAVAASR